MKTDAELADDISRGHTGAWGEVFDRHRDAVWHVALAVTRNPSDAEDVVQSTFLKANERFDQLRDPAKLRPWLLSIARSDALDRVRRIQPGELHDHAMPVDDRDPGSDLRRTEIAALVQAAFDGLEPRDRLALELTERHDVSRSELAEVLGVSTDNAYVVHMNARNRFCRSIEAFVVARTGASACADLASLLGDWDGTLDPRLRKRLARHIDGCSTCEGTREREVSPAALLGTLPLLGVPAEVAGRLRSRLSPPAGPTAGATPAATAPAAAAVSAPKLVVAGVAALLVAGGAAVAVARAGGDTVVAQQQEPVPAATSAVDQPAPPEDVVVPTAIPGQEPPSDLDTDDATEPSDTGDTGQPAAVAQTRCGLADSLRELAEPGPAGASPPEVEAYVVAVNAALQALADADGTPAVVEYATSYQALVDAQAWNDMPLPDDPRFRAQRDALQEHLTATCPGN